MKKTQKKMEKEKKEKEGLQLWVERDKSWVCQRGGAFNAIISEVGRMSALNKVKNVNTWV